MSESVSKSKRVNGPDLKLRHACYPTFLFHNNNGRQERIFPTRVENDLDEAVLSAPVVINLKKNVLVLHINSNYPVARVNYYTGYLMEIYILMPLHFIVRERMMRIFNYEKSACCACATSYIEFSLSPIFIINMWENVGRGSLKGVCNEMLPRIDCSRWVRLFRECVLHRRRGIFHLQPRVFAREHSGSRND